MNKNNAIQLLGRATALSIAFGVALSGAATARPLDPTFGMIPPVQPAEARIHVAQAAATPATFSESQAESGQRRFVRDCAECHGEDLNGGLLGGPPLRGLSFDQKWFSGVPASALHAYMSSAMPPEAPGRFSPTAYTEMLAYIMKLNGFEAGAELPNTLEGLDAVILQK